MAFSLDQFRLDDRVAIVTGAGGRGNSIGRAYALGLAGAGAKVLVADLNGEGARRVADEIAAAGLQALAVTVDITDRESVAAMVETARATWGHVDILVNNAALMVELSYTPAFECPPEEWNKILEVNLTGALNCSQAVIPLMREQGSGKIVNQLSAGAFPAQSVYGVSKLALKGLTTTLATELGPLGINVNAIAPGVTQSDAGKSLAAEGSEFHNSLLYKVVMRIDGQPDELLGALLLLCSSAGDWMTGQVLNVDGGWVLQ